MIEQIIPKLREYLGCEVIMGNQTTKRPAYPFVTYNIMMFRNTTAGHPYLNQESLTYYKNFEQTWSFSTQSDTPDGTRILADKLYRFFEMIGHDFLVKQNTVVKNLSNVTNRDNIFSNIYEYRLGFDVTFIITDVYTPDDLSKVAMQNAEITEIKEV